MKRQWVFEGTGQCLSQGTIVLIELSSEDSDFRFSPFDRFSRLCYLFMCFPILIAYVVQIVDYVSF
jgi:hypothetical protein